MAEYLREQFALTQARLAFWLGINRASLALAETGRRNFPLGSGVQDARMVLAAQGIVLGENGTSAPGPPPLPPPAPNLAPLEARLSYCRYTINNQRYALEKMRKRAIPYEARLTALPALRAYTGPVLNPAREETWLAVFEGDAVDALRNDCGTGPQRMLEARIAGLEREAELLEAILPAAP